MPGGAGPLVDLPRSARPGRPGRRAAAMRISVIRLPPSASPWDADADRHGHHELVDQGAVLLVVATQPGRHAGQEGVVEGAVGARAGLLQRPTAGPRARPSSRISAPVLHDRRRGLVDGPHRAVDRGRGLPRPTAAVVRGCRTPSTTSVAPTDGGGPRTVRPSRAASYATAWRTRVEPAGLGRLGHGGQRAEVGAARAGRRRRGRRSACRRCRRRGSGASYDERRAAVARAPRRGSPSTSAGRGRTRSSRRGVPSPAPSPACRGAGR